MGFKQVKTDFPEIRIWIFNVQVRSVVDQLDFLSTCLKEYGYKVTISNKPSLNSLNVIIENISEKTYPIIENFCNQFNKRLAVVMTEHIEFINGKILFHGLPFNNASDYMHPLTRRARFLHLLKSRNFIHFFLKLGDLPSLEGVENIFGDIPIYSLPFPNITPFEQKLKLGELKYYDLVFSGMRTSYRDRVLNGLSKKYDIFVQNKQLSRRRRNILNSSAKAVINIPQDASWKWVSTMRILSAWSCNRPVINFSERKLQGALFDFCLNISDFQDTEEIISEALLNPQVLLETQLSDYYKYIKNNNKQKFPHSIFNSWALTEKL